MIRIYTESCLTYNKVFFLTKAQTHYLNNVMRKKNNDEILCFDGLNGEWICNIENITKKECSVRAVKQTRSQKDEVDLWLCFAIVKNTPLNNIIQKATELGITKFIPLITERTVVNKINIERLTAVAIEASEQSDRLTVPHFQDVVKLNSLLKSWSNDANIILCDESGKSAPFFEVVSNIENKTNAILIGPEGGFTKNEFEIIKSYDYVKSVGLGPRILRADTAAISCISCFMSIKGDWNERPNFKPE